MALWNEKLTPAPPGRKEPMTPAPSGPAVQPAAAPQPERNLAERGTTEAALAAAPRRPTPRERGEGGESVIAANLTIEGKIEGSGNVRMAGRFKGDVRIDGNFTIDPGAHLTGQVLAGIVVVGLAGRKMSKYSAIAGLCVSLVLFGLLVACGGSSSPPVAVSVSPTGATVFANDTADNWPPQTASFTATVTNTSNTAVNWTVTPATAGTITAAGVYTAPTAAEGLPTSATVTATSQASSTAIGTATVTITPTTVPGSYPITVTATEGPTSNTTSAITLKVN